VNTKGLTILFIVLIIQDTKVGQYMFINGVMYDAIWLAFYHLNYPEMKVKDSRQRILATIYAAYIGINILGCSKHLDINQELSFETGIYTGVLVNQSSGISNLDFKISVSKIDERKYSVKQITPGDVPDFTYTINKAVTPEDIQLEQARYFKGTVPLQGTSPASIVGDGATTGEEDISYYVPQKRLTFTIRINNAGIRIVFSGVKE
jgi:hypothetical protein